ncbi:MAG: efflux RND transporter periplasmic adaptor subunit [Candidatus Marinimicrobia bacterium CG08_land_8_20_14_0_20_45_22]|nr:MAG: efflux RND transporter periplasmic adaptor subunit [Candidatus Marinimicrobia bacterium CG08_land_8_20_14_0_20_45_22]
MKKKSKKKLIIILIILAVVAVFVVMNFTKDKVKPIVVQTDKVKREKIVQTVNASGSLIPVTQVKISANVSAKIMNLTVKEGDRVKKGELLVELDKEQYEAAYDKAFSYVQSNKASLKKVQSDLKRTQALYQSNLTSESELEAATAQAELAESQVHQSEAALKQALDDLNKTRIASPMNGIVTSLNKEIGEIALGSVFQEDVILIVSDMSKMEVKIEVDETDVVNLSIGDTAKIQIDAIPNTTYKGVVAEIAHSATTKGAGTQEQVTNFEVSISVLGQDTRFRPGMSSTVDVITDTKENALVVPIQSLTARSPDDTASVAFESDNKKKPEPTAEEPERIKRANSENNKEEEVVFVVIHPDKKDTPKKSMIKKRSYPKAEQRSVKIGISSDTKFEILSGLQEGEEIVVGSYKAISKEIKNGSPLKIGGPTDKKGETK